MEALAKMWLPAYYGFGGNVSAFSSKNAAQPGGDNGVVAHQVVAELRGVSKSFGGQLPWTTCLLN